MKAVFKTASPYKKDAMALPVADVDKAIPFYETIMGFKLLSRSSAPVKSAILGRDQVQIGLAENGGDSSQEGCFFEVDNVETAFAELNANGLNKKDPNYDVQTMGTVPYRMFFVVAPDGLCYCLGVPHKG